MPMITVYDVYDIVASAIKGFCSDVLHDGDGGISVADARSISFNAESPNLIFNDGNNDASGMPNYSLCGFCEIPTKIHKYPHHGMGIRVDFDRYLICGDQNIRMVFYNVYYTVAYHDDYTEFAIETLLIKRNTRKYRFLDNVVQPIMLDMLFNSWVIVKSANDGPAKKAYAAQVKASPSCAEFAVMTAARYSKTKWLSYLLHAAFAVSSELGVRYTTVASLYSSDDPETAATVLHIKNQYADIFKSLDGGGLTL